MDERKRVIIYSVNTNNFDKFKFEKSIQNIFKSNYNFEYFIFTDEEMDLSDHKFLHFSQICLRRKICWKNSNHFLSIDIYFSISYC